MQDRRVGLLCLFKSLHWNRSTQRQQYPNRSLVMEQTLRGPSHSRQLASFWMHRVGFLYSSTKVIPLSKSVLSGTVVKMRGVCKHLGCASFFLDHAVTLFTNMSQSDYPRWIVQVYNFPVKHFCSLKVNIYTFSQIKTLCKLYTERDLIFCSRFRAYIRLFGEYGHTVISFVVYLTCNHLERAVNGSAENIDLNCLRMERDAMVGEGRADDGSDGVLWNLWSVAVILKVEYLQSRTYEVKRQSMPPNPQLCRRWRQLLRDSRPLLTTVCLHSPKKLNLADVQKN